MKQLTYTANSANAPLEPISSNLPKELGAQDIVIAITHCGVCRSDWHFLQDSWGDAKFPLVPGHEIVGHIIAKGSAVKEFALEERVGVSWQVGSCNECHWCHHEREEFCAEIKGIGIGAQGGFADYIIVDQHFVYHLPDAIDSAHAAPLLCAGSTVFNAFYRFDVKPGMRVGILGIGGLGHLAVQFAAALGCQVTAFTDDMSRAEEIKGMGAEVVLPSDDLKSLQGLSAQFDFILSTIDTDINYQPFIDLLHPLGKFCFAGIPAKPVEISVFSLIIGEKMIGAVPVGNRQSIIKMLQFAAKHHIQPYIELMPMHEVNQALAKLAAGQAHYRIVLFNN